METSAPGTAATRAPFLLGSDVKRVLVLAVPAMLAFLTQTAVNIVDTAFFKGLPVRDRTDGQSILSSSLILLWSVGGFFSAIGVGTQAMVARRTGEKDPRAAGAVLQNAVMLGSLVSLVASAGVYFAIPAAFHAIMPTNAHAAALGSAYTQWRFVGVVTMVATAAYKAYFDGTARTYVHFLASIVMNVVNVLLCWMFIFGHLGAPAMGVAGAGVAGAASSWVGAIVMLGFSLGGGDRRERAPYRRGALSGRTMWELARVSLPSGFATTVIMTGFFLFRLIVERYLDAPHVAALVAAGHHVDQGEGSIYGASTTIIIQVLSVTFFSCMAFGVATATLVSQALGAKKPDEAERIAWTSVKLGVIAFSVLGALEVAFPEALIRMFNDAPEVVAAAAPSMRLTGACGPIIAVGMILTQALFGAGNTRFVMVVELCLHLVWLVPGAYLLGVVAHGGLLGVWGAAAIYVALMATAMVWKFRQGDWKSIRL